MDRPDLQAIAGGAAAHAITIRYYSRHRPPGLRRLARRPNRARPALRPLNRDETRLAITAMWPQGQPSTSPELLDAVERVTGGVPLFIEEICQWMAENAAAATDRLARSGTRSHASVFESVIEAQA